MSYRIRWTAADHNSPVAISATKTESEGHLDFESNLPASKRDLSCMREGTLDAKSQRMRWGEYAYVLTGKDETFDDVVDHVADWKIGTYYEVYPASRQAIRALFKPLMVDLNPKSASSPKLHAGERILIPGPEKVRRVVDNSPLVNDLREAAKRARNRLEK